MDALTDKVKETLHVTSSPAEAIPMHLAEHTATHAPVSNVATWKDALAQSTVPAAPHVLTKTVVFKPKVAKTQQAVLIMVVALEATTGTSSAHVAKAAGEKEARQAAADLVKETLGVTDKQGTDNLLLFFLGFLGDGD
jgi:Aminoacyl-tRNA editing domain